MGTIHRVGSLEIDQDLDFERREWRVQRIAWVLGVLVLVVGFLGLLGGGPLSAGGTTSGPLALDYQRLARQEADAPLRLHVAPDTAVDGQIAVWLDRAYLARVDIAQVIPEPVETEMGESRVIYHLAVADPAQPATITLRTVPGEPGLVSGRLGIVDGAEVAFTQFIYP